MWRDFRTNRDYFLLQRHPTAFFVTETESVYCAVRAESVNTVQVNLSVSACNSAATSSDFTVAPNGRLLLNNELLRILQVVIL